MNWITSIASASVLICTTAHGQDVPLKRCDVNNECEGGVTDNQQIECIGRILDREDDRLNDLYSDLLSHIQGNYDDPNQLIERLRESQRNWIMYRDNYCRYRYYTAEGSGGGLLESMCRCTLTRDKADHFFDEFPI